MCKPDYDDKRFLKRFELFINGTEIANAYSESNVPAQDIVRTITATCSSSPP